MSLEKYVQSARQWNRAESDAKYWLHWEAMERAVRRASPWYNRAWVAIHEWLDWLPGFVFGTTLAPSVSPWYALPGGFGAIDLGWPDAHPDSLGWLARRRMLASDPLVIPGERTGTKYDPSMDHWD